MSAASSLGGLGAALSSQGDSAPVRGRAWRGVLLTMLLVLLLHGLFLRGVSRWLPDMPEGMAGEDAGQVFSTRSIRINNQEAENTAKTSQGKNTAPVPQSAGTLVPGLANSEPLQEALQGNTVSFVSEAATQPATAASGAAPTDSAHAAPAAGVPEASPASAGAPAVSAPLVASTPAAPSAPPASDTALASAQTGASTGSPPPAYNYVFPPSVRLKYDVSGILKGFKYFVSGDLSWLHDGSSYTARLEISHFLLGSRVQTSKGAITPRGLEPVRYGEKVRSEVAAHFEREKAKVSFSANTPDVPLMPLAQDQVSIFVQLAAMFAANGSAFLPGSKLVFQTVGARGAEDWDFLVEPPERQKIQGKEWMAYKLVREHRADYDTRAELWLAPELEGMPLRIRLTQTSGDEIDMVWTRSQKP